MRVHKAIKYSTPREGEDAAAGPDVTVFVCRVSEAYSKISRWLPKHAYATLTLCARIQIDPMGVNCQRLFHNLISFHRCRYRH